MKNVLFFGIWILLFAGCSLHNQTFSTFKQFNDVNVSDSLEITDKKTSLLVKSFLTYWHARQNGDTNTSYQYELPYQRYITPYNKYKKLVSGLYYGKRTELKNITFSHNQNIAIIDRNVYLQNNFSYPKKDKWIFFKNRWYHKFYQTVLPPKTKEEVEFQ